jgi:hypothetical protein
MHIEREQVNMLLSRYGTIDGSMDALRIGRNEPRRAVVTALRQPPGGTAAEANVLQLQRRAGNQAVASLLGATGLAVQRDSGAPEGAGTDDSDVKSEFDAEYNKYAGKFTFLAQQQTNAVEAVYTEAKKPSKPSLIEDLLVTLAMASLGGAVSILGQSLERALQPKLRSELESAYLQKYWGSDSRDMKRVEEAIENAKNSSILQAQIVAKAANDAFKDGAKSFVQPRVKKLLAEGATPVDAFFQGQKNAVVDLAAAKFDAAEDGRPKLWRLHHLNPRLPYAVAVALRLAADEVFAEAQPVQERQTLDQWLAYTAQAYQGKWEGKKSPEKGGTDLSSELYWEGTAPGVLHVMAHIEDVSPTYVAPPDPDDTTATKRPGRAAINGKTYAAFADRGFMFGLTDKMIGILDGPIFNLGIPVVYSMSSRDALDGVGRPDGGLDFRQAKSSFSIGVNENGAVVLGERTLIQDEALKRCGGADGIIRQLGVRDLKSLGVSADHG